MFYLNYYGLAIMRSLSRFHGYVSIISTKLYREVSQLIPTHIQSITYINTRDYSVKTISENRFLTVLKILLNFFQINIHSVYDDFIPSCAMTKLKSKSKNASDMSTEFLAIKIWSNLTQKSEYIMLDRDLLANTLKGYHEYPLDELLLMLDGVNCSIFSVTIDSKPAAYPIDEYLDSLSIVCNITARALYVYHCYLSDTLLEKTPNDTCEVNLIDYDLKDFMYKDDEFLTSYFD